MSVTRRAATVLMSFLFCSITEKERSSRQTHLLSPAETKRPACDRASQPPSRAKEGERNSCSQERLTIASYILHGGSFGRSFALGGQGGASGHCGKRRTTTCPSARTTKWRSCLNCQMEPSWRTRFCGGNATAFKSVDDSDMIRVGNDSTTCRDPVFRQCSWSCSALPMSLVFGVARLVYNDAVAQDRGATILGPFWHGHVTRGQSQLKMWPFSSQEFTNDFPVQWKLLVCKISNICHVCSPRHADL